MGTAYWGGLLDWLRTTAADTGTINARDLELLTVTDDVDEAIAAIVAAETPAGGLGGVRQPPTGAAKATPPATRPE
jgi:predicted Rossmann-fold nucleotide-binding protein